MGHSEIPPWTKKLIDLNSINKNNGIDINIAEGLATAYSIQLWLHWWEGRTAFFTAVEKTLKNENIRCSSLIPLLEYMLTAFNNVLKKKRNLVIERIKSKTNYLADALSRDTEMEFLGVFPKAKMINLDFQMIEKYMIENNRYLFSEKFKKF